ncbi:MAG: hypothetical protein EBT08_00795 [Betaproteobacteria bacterium]|nr:hypothetical protein [Betaproteobacteria bacterium]
MSSLCQNGYPQGLEGNPDRTAHLTPLLKATRKKRPRPQNSAAREVSNDRSMQVGWRPLTGNSSHDRANRSDGIAR